MNRSESFVLLLNPKAGGGRARDRLPLIQQALREEGATFETMLTRERGDATTIVRAAIERGVRGIVVASGDGTLNEAVNGFFDSDGVAVPGEPWLGYIAAGTGNDFRRAMRVRDDVRVMVTRMMWAKPQPIDVGFVHCQDERGREVRRAFINVATFGLGGVVDAIVNRWSTRLGGPPTFALGTLRALAQFRNRRIRLTIDDLAPVEHDIVNVAIANGRAFGGGMRIAPEARLDDGLLDVVVLRAMRKRALLQLAPQLYRGTHIGREGVVYCTGRRIIAEPADWMGPVLLDLDGEPVGHLPATFEIRPGAIRLRA